MSMFYDHANLGWGVLGGVLVVGLGVILPTVVHNRRAV
jgi:hypothetical protein